MSTTGSLQQIYETTEYLDLEPEQAALFDVRIPVSGIPTEINTRITGVDIDLTRPGHFWGVGAAAYFGASNEILFKPIYYPDLRDGESVTVEISWRVGEQTHEASVLVNGQTGDDVPSDVWRPELEGSDAADLIVGSNMGGTPGTSDNDLFWGYGGNDRIFGRFGGDVMVGGLGDDYIEGGIGGFYQGTSRSDYLYGEEGDDILIADPPDQIPGGGDYLDGGPGDDHLVGTFGEDYLIGGEGDDHIVPLNGADQVYGEAGTDTVDYSSAPHGVVVLLIETDQFGVGGQFRDAGRGGYAPPGWLGDPEFSAAGGDEYHGVENVIGSAFDDLVYGTAVATVANLGAGDDVFDNLNASVVGPIEFDDIVHGFAGNDRIWTGRGDDHLHGGEGNDRLKGEAGNDYIEGGPGNDLLVGGAGDDTLLGMEGDDRLNGGAGNDQLLGYAGSDRLTGGPGVDTHEGAEGSDCYVFRSASESGPGDLADTITRIDGTDRIDLSAIDADAGTAGDQAFMFLGNEAFSGAGGELRIVESSFFLQLVQADIDGDLAQDLEIRIFDSDGPVQLGQANFVL